MLAIELANKLRDLKLSAVSRAKKTLKTPITEPRNRHFELPSLGECTAALGDVTEETDRDPVCREAFSVFGFPTLQYPGPHDYLQANHVVGQSFESFKKDRSGIRLSHKRKAVYILPIGEFENPTFLERIRQYISLYLQLEVHVLNAIDLQDLPVAKRVCETQLAEEVLQHEQFSCKDMLKLIRDAVPSDGACILALTMVDVFGEQTPNTHVFGQLYPRGRIGIFSLSRFDPKFYRESHILIKPKHYWRVLLKRAFKVLVPELLKLMGLRPCAFFQCMMQGSGYLEELDAKMMHLCPVCLRKLHHLIKFDVHRRYIDLAGFYNHLGLRHSLAMIESRLEALVLAKQERDTLIKKEQAKYEAEQAALPREQRDRAVAEGDAATTGTPAEDEGVSLAAVEGGGGSATDLNPNGAAKEELAGSRNTSESKLGASGGGVSSGTGSPAQSPRTPRAASVNKDTQSVRRDSLEASLSGSFNSNRRLDAGARRHVRRLSVMMDEHIFRLRRNSATETSPTAEG